MSEGFIRPASSNSWKALATLRLVGDREHPHPAPEQAQLVDGVEALRAARDLHDRERPALRRAHRAEAQRRLVDLRLHQAGHLAVALGAAPDHALGPERELAQLLDFADGRRGDLVGQRQVRGSKMRVSAPKCCSSRAASSVAGG